MDYNYPCSCRLTVGENDDIITIRRCDLPTDQCCAHPTDPEVLERNHEAAKARILEKYGSLPTRKSDLPAEELQELRDQMDNEKWSLENQAKWWDLLVENFYCQYAPDPRLRQTMLSVIRDEKVSRVTSHLLT
jgi:hypothetical protein